MTENTKPGLFGIKNSNRDFSLPESWGKNQFNNSFPIGLTCYMASKKIDPIHLLLDQNLALTHSSITVEELLGLPYNSDNLFFSFEESFTPYADLVIGQLPRADLVTRNSATPNKDCLAGFEIKLTALPDNSTCDLDDESLYGSEIVVRPDTIVYIALAIAKLYTHKKDDLKALTSPTCSKITGWEDAENVRHNLPNFIQTIDSILKANINHQTPLLLQPVWKTQKKKGTLSKDCFDVFVWTDFAITRLFIDPSRNKNSVFGRMERAVVWLIKMLDDFANLGKINPGQVTGQLTYNTRNDKAFAVSGRMTNPYMKSQSLTKPRVSKYAVKEIILGGGQNYLSPERRLDAIILNSPDLFD
ncbi:MAG: HindVP family restriction endonuclease [Nitrospirae bacterium]|nr:HindVP family restriction endonuclease [Nitrospirota bacterium]